MDAEWEKTQRINKIYNDRKSNIIIRIPLNTGKDNVDVHVWNAHSIRNRTFCINNHLVVNDVDVFVITESWMGPDDAVVFSGMHSAGILVSKFPSGK